MTTPNQTAPAANTTKLDVDFEYVAPAAPTPEPLKAGEVSAVAAARVTAQEENFAKLGYTMKGKRGYDAGAQINETGKKNLESSRREWEKQPDTLVALQNFDTLIAAENRAVTKTQLSRIKCLGATGNLTLGAAGEGAVPTKTALNHVATYLAPGTRLAGYLPNAPMSVRADLVNFYSRQLAADEDAEHAAWAASPIRDRSGKPVGEPTREKVAVAHRVRNGQREVYRVASTSYAPFEAHDAARTLLNNADVMKALAGSKSEINYDGERATIDVLWHEDRTVDFACGDVFKAGLRIKLDEVKGGSTVVQATALRNLCLNLIILGTAEKTHLRRRHIGALSGAQGLVAQFLAAVQSARGEMDAFIGVWTAARQERILDGYSGDASAVFRGLIGAGMVDALPGTGEEKLERLMAAYSFEPGPSKADFSNAITRAAHTAGDWWNGDVFAQQALEAQGSQVLYVGALGTKVERGLETWGDKYGEFN